MNNCRRCGLPHDFQVPCATARGQAWLRDAAMPSAETRMFELLKFIQQRYWDKPSLTDSETMMLDKINSLLIEVSNERKERR